MDSNKDRAAPDALHKVLESALGEFEHVPSDCKAQHEVQNVHAARASSSIATFQRTTSTASSSSAQESSEPAADLIELLLGDYEHIRDASNSGSLLSERYTNVGREQSMTMVHILQPEGTSLEAWGNKSCSMDPSVGCVGQLSRATDCEIGYICLATFRKPEWPVTLATAPIDRKFPGGYASSSSVNGVSTGTLVERRITTLAVEEAVLMHEAMFPEISAAHMHSQCLPLLRGAISALGAEDHMMPLVHASLDLAQWSDRYHLYLQGVITQCQSHLGHKFPAAWSWDKVSLSLMH